MKKAFSLLSLAALTIGLLGSCSKINERLDGLDKRINSLENDKIASVEQQISAINQSIADLETIRTNIRTLIDAKTAQGEDITKLKAADQALEGKINDLRDYINTELSKYSTKDWVNATFATLEQHQWTCDTIAKIDARIGALDANLSQSISGLESSLNQWVNEQLDAYYTAAQMDAKLDVMRNDINNAKAQGKTATDKADSLATELTTLKAAVDSAKANIRSEYKDAVQSAIETSEGKLSKALKDSIAEVNNKISALDTKVTTLEGKVLALEGKVDKLLAMVQSVAIVPVYSDGSLEEVEGGILTIDCIISPASAANSLTKDYFKVLVNTVKTKAVTLDTVKVSDIKIGENGIVSIFAQAPAKPSTGVYAAALRIVQTDANADYTTEFHTFDYSGKNVKVVDLKENDTEYNKVYIAPSDPTDPKTVGGAIPAEIEDGKKTFDGDKPTVIEVRGIGTVTFDKTATAKIAENANGADQVYFTVKDVTSDAQKQAKEIVYQVTMTKVSEQGEEVFSVSNAAGEVTMEIPLGSDVADVTKVTLLDDSGNSISGGVVYGSVIYDSENKIVTFKVNHFSRYAVGYVLQKDYKPVTDISLDKSALELEKGISKKLIATITPTDASNKNVIWSSSDTSKVKVDTAGKVTAVALGTATVTATSMNDRSKTATCEVTVVALKKYVEIAAKYNGSTTTNLRWYRQSLAITDSGRKAWKGGSGSAVKIPGTDEDVVVGDYFPWGTFAGFYGSGADSDKGLLPYSAFTNTGCGDASNGFTFKDDKQFKKENTPYYSGSAYTKYNTTDGKTALEASDDVASIILGDTWRMPTKDELQAMKEATYWAWDATDKGYYVYDPNPATDAGKVNNGTGTYNKADALLFFPATGYGENTSMTSAGTYGYYRSSTLNSENTEHAYRLYFYNGGVNPNVYTYRYFGFSVRPVQDPAATYKAVSGVTFDVEKKEVVEGVNVQLSATVSPADATNKGVYWTSSDTTVAKVDALGKVTAVKAGTATITATTVDGTKTATCTVTVKKTMAEILKTATGIPESQDLTPPANAWVNSTDPDCKAFVGVDEGEKVFIMYKKELVDPETQKYKITKYKMLMDDVFDKIDETTYKYVDEVATVTVKMTGGKFTSCECEFNLTELQVLNGTYAAPASPLPAGALKGVFSVSATKKVHFSKGNLYWDGDSYEFEANQYTIGTWNAENHVNYFFWSKKESVVKAASYADASAAASDVFFTNATAETAKADFTVSGVTGKFRTLSAEEWTYILSTRANAVNLLVEDVTVCGVEHCLVIAPDACLNSYVFDKTKKSYDAAAWATAEAAGLICLPPAGYRNGTDVKSGEGNGFYWASTTDAADKASNLGFKKSDN